MREFGLPELFKNTAREKQRWLEKIAEQSYLNDSIPGSYLEEFVGQNLVSVSQGLISITVRGQIEVHRKRFGAVPGSGIVTYGQKPEKEPKFVDKFVKWIWGIDRR